MEVSVIKIGNSKGLRLSKSILDRYNITDRVVLIFEDGHIVLKPISAPRAGWEEAFWQMHEAGEDNLLIDDVFEDEDFEPCLPASGGSYAQYDVVLVNLDPTAGSEIKKTRPCIIISPDEMNRHLNTLTIAPVTSSGKAYPTRVAAKYAGKPGRVVIDQLRTIDKKSVVKTLGSLSKAEIGRCKQVIRETFVD